MKVRFLAAARGDLKAAIAYFEQQRRGLGAEFHTGVRSTVAQIQALPEGWQSLGDNIRRCRTRRFPYGLIYAVTASDILILAIAHLHREPDHWRERFP